MRKFDKYLYDNIGREYDRKNLYLYDVAVLQEQLSGATKEEKDTLKAKLDELVKNKNEHKYIKSLNQYKVEEKKYLDSLKKSTEEFNTTIDKTLPKKVQGLEVRLFRAKKNLEFYKKYIKLTYDAELIYESSKIEIMQIPPVIEFAKKAIEETKIAKENINKVDNSQLENYKKDYEKFKAEAKVNLSERIKEVKEKQKEGLISKQAEETTIKGLKKEFEDAVLMKSFENKKIYNEEIIKNKQHELTKVLKQKINTVNINVADLRRVYPIEVDKTVPVNSYLTFLIPGLGQLLNKQYIKSIIMFFATIYIYLMAIPYALGFGNYKGDGIAGLITLGANGGRLDRSIIFMIEGILAIFMVAIAVILMYLSFRDANRVEKDTIKGVRCKNWIETYQTLTEDGFPYLVLSPAAIVTIFIVFIPIATTLLLALTGMGPDTQAKFGWEALNNYKMLVLGQGMVGSIFWKILGWTIVWTIGATTLGVALGFILAIILNNDRIKGKALFRSVYLLPWAVPSFITIMFFSILAAENGIITTSLQGIFGSGFSIKNDPFVSRVFLICVQAWLGSSYVFLLSTGVLQSINNELYEAADIDGATSFKKLTKITIPLVLFQTAPLLVGQYTFNFNNFNIIYLFNGGGPFDPTKYGHLAGSTDLLISYIFKLTMENQYQALGAAITVIISIGLIIIAYIGYKNTAAFKKE